MSKVRQNTSQNTFTAKKTGSSSLPEPGNEGRRSGKGREDSFQSLKHINNELLMEATCFKGVRHLEVKLLAMLTGLASWHLRGTPASSVLEYSGAPPPKRLPIPALNPPEPCELVSMAVKVSKCQTGTWKEVASWAEAANVSRFVTLKNIRRAAGVTATNKLCPDTMSFVFNLNVK